MSLQLGLKITHDIVAEKIYDIIGGLACHIGIINRWKPSNVYMNVNSTHNTKELQYLCYQALLSEISEMIMITTGYQSVFNPLRIFCLKCKQNLN